MSPEDAEDIAGILERMYDLATTYCVGFNNVTMTFRWVGPSGPGEFFRDWESRWRHSTLGGIEMVPEWHHQLAALADKYKRTIQMLFADLVIKGCYIDWTLTNGDCL